MLTTALGKCLIDTLIACQLIAHSRLAKVSLLNLDAFQQTHSGKNVITNSERKPGKFAGHVFFRKYRTKYFLSIPFF